MLTKHLRRIPNAWHFGFALALVFTALYFQFGGLRCSPLNAALRLSIEIGSKAIGIISGKMCFRFQKEESDA